MALREIKTHEEFDSFVNNTKLSVVHFYADWAAECKPMNEVLETLALEKDLKNVMFAKIPAENFPKISMEKKIVAVPTFLLFISGNLVDRLDGANAAKLTQLVKNNIAKAELLEDAAPVPDISGKVLPVTSAPSIKSPVNVAPTDINEILKKLINKSPVILFMKGNAENPQCGFSRQAIALLNQFNAEYDTFDILKDDNVRQGLKTYANWPTYPQLYINGELIGGLDIMKEMAEGGELEGMLKKKQPIEERLKALINQSPLMIFMKGNRATPRCGFSRQLIDIINETKLPYETFDILSDEEVRQSLKTYSNWPTYPQVYANGNLVGGLDIIKELKESDELLSTLKE